MNRTKIPKIDESESEKQIDLQNHRFSPFQMLVKDKEET